MIIVHLTNLFIIRICNFITVRFSFSFPKKLSYGGSLSDSFFMSELTLSQIILYYCNKLSKKKIHQFSFNLIYFNFTQFNLIYITFNFMIIIQLTNRALTVFFTRRNLFLILILFRTFMILKFIFLNFSFKHTLKFISPFYMW